MIARPVAAGDYDQWLHLWDGYNAFYGRTGATALPRDVTTTTWTRFLDPDVPVHALVADQDARLLGFAHYLFHASTTAIEPVCYLQDLFTVDDARGQGVARTLIDEVADRAADGGARRLYWQTHATNEPARALYDTIAAHRGYLVYDRQTPS